MASELSVREIAEIQQAAHLAGHIPEIEVEIASMTRALTNKVFDALSKGELTPERAYEYWLEMYAYNRIGKRFREKAKTADQYTETIRR